MGFNPGFNFDGPNPPCGRNCPDRSAGCAVVCERWLAYVEDRNRNYKARLKKKEDKGLTAACEKAAIGKAVPSDFRKKKRR